MSLPDDSAAIAKQLQLEMGLFAKEEKPELATIFYLYSKGRFSKEDFNSLFEGSSQADIKRKLLSCPYLARWIVDTHQDAGKLSHDLQNSLQLESTYKIVIRHFQQLHKKEEAELADLVGHGKLPHHPFYMNDEEVKQLSHYAQQIIVDIRSVEDFVTPTLKKTMKRPSPRD